MFLLIVTLVDVFFIFVADVEELSARLSLMAAASSEKGEILEPSLGPIHDGNYLKNRCVYLEQLLNGNYIHFSIVWLYGDEPIP